MRNRRAIRRSTVRPDAVGPRMINGLLVIGLVLVVQAGAEPLVEGRVRLVSGGPAAGVQVRLEVFNILGQRIATLVDGEQSAGFHTAQWNATDAAGQAVAAGVYLYRLQGAGVSLTRRMVLVDGQAGTPAGSSGGSPMATAGAGESGSVYGLTVSGAGLVPYVDPAFRVAVGQDSVEVVVEALESMPRGKTAAFSGGILGNVNNTDHVDFFDALLVALYSQDASIVMPNNGNISQGDVNADGRVDLADAYLIATYLNDPSDPALPAGIGEPWEPTVRDALVALYNSTDGPNWRFKFNWLSDKPIEEWHGVTTDSSGHVTRLGLYRNGEESSVLSAGV